MKDFYAGLLIQSLVDIRTQIENGKGVKRITSATKNGVVYNSIVASDRCIIGECVCTSSFGIIQSSTLLKLWCGGRSIEKDVNGRSWNVFKFNDNEHMEFYKDVTNGKNKFKVKYINDGKCGKMTSVVK